MEEGRSDTDSTYQLEDSSNSTAEETEDKERAERPEGLLEAIVATLAEVARQFCVSGQAIVELIKEEEVGISKAITKEATAGEEEARAASSSAPAV